MQIKSLSAENFRLLASKEKNKIILDKDYTLIVGRNNSGKTSFIELVEKFLSDSDSNKFKFADFSISSYKHFTKAYEIYEEIQELK